MKPLPEDPPVYQRPPERWFEVHEHEMISNKSKDWERTGAFVTSPSENMVAIVRTRQAMLLTFLDYIGLPLEKTDKPMPAALGNLCSTFISANSKPSCMSVWRELCKNATLKEDETPEKLFVRLLQTGAKRGAT